MSFSILLTSHAHTEALGEKIGLIAQNGLVVALHGDLGTGKSVIARGIARGLGIQGRIPSPTFTLANQYEGRLIFHHLDLYRLSDPEELAQLGFDEFIGEEGVSAVEWPSRAEHLLGPDCLHLSLSDADPQSRWAELRSTGPKSDRVLQFIRESWSE